MKFEVEKEKLDALISYMAKRPFAEVHDLIYSLQGLKPVQELEADLKALENKAEAGLKAVESKIKAELSPSDPTTPSAA